MSNPPQNTRELQEQAIKLLPPPPNCCQTCGCLHWPDVPHNAQSVYYRARFAMEYGREPTWHDAMAHCDEATKERWRRMLVNRGVFIDS